MLYQVCYTGFIYKLLKVKIPTPYVQYTFSYHRGTTFIVCCTIKQYTPQPFNAGVPLSSKLGFWLYKIYIQDIYRSPHTSLTLYADDTTIMTYNTDLVQVQLHPHLQSHVHLLENFFTKRRMKVAFKKIYCYLFLKKTYFTFLSQLKWLICELKQWGGGGACKYTVVQIFLGESSSSIASTKFQKEKNDLAHMIYSYEMTIANKVIFMKQYSTPYFSTVL